MSHNQSVIRVLVVDDSASMRKALSMMIAVRGEIEVIATARDGQEAIEMVKRLRPDLVTMDIEMPRLDGVSAVKTIMAEAPCPVIMVSSMTTEGARATLEALAAGAVDFIPKQMSVFSGEGSGIGSELIDKIRSIVEATRLRGTGRSEANDSVPRSASPRVGDVPVRGNATRAESESFVYRRARLLAIGVSTGGPAALQHLIPMLPRDFPVPVVIVQHMPPKFTRSLALRLDCMSPLEVVEAEEGMEVQPGRVIVARGDRHLTFRRENDATYAALSSTPVTVHRPSADVTFEAAARGFAGRVLAVVMTGMGRDGCAGAQVIKQMGGKVVAQAADSCAVYGMPRAIVEAHLADTIVPLAELAPTLIRAVCGPGAIRSGLPPPCSSDILRTSRTP